MTIWKRDPTDVLREAFDEALFLWFRAGCRYLSRELILDGTEEYNQCTHPENKNAPEFGGPAGKNKQLPGCISANCPIIKTQGFRLPEEEDSPFTLWNHFRKKLAKIP